MAAFESKLHTACTARTLRRLRIRPADGPPVDVSPVDLATGPHWSFVTHEERRDVTRNMPLETAAGKALSLLRGGGSALLEAEDGAWQLVATPGRKPRLVSHGRPAAGPADSRRHDRERRSRLGPQALPWLRALGLVGESGRPPADRARKLRQVERYADLLAHAVTAATVASGDILSVVDMGCGKGSLTFAAWHVLRAELRLDARVTGIDRDAALVADANAVAASVRAEHIEFRAGDIDSADLPATDILIALHACDTATDDALARGVRAGCRVILAAPCCQKELRRSLGEPDPLAPILSHGLFRERFSEWLTDGLRCLALQAAGYRGTVADFIEAEHTPKNLLLTAVRGLPDAKRAAARAEYDRIREWAGLRALATDALL